MIMQKDIIQETAEETFKGTARFITWRYMLVLLISIFPGCYANGQLTGSNKPICDQEWNLLQNRMEEAIRRYKFLAETFDSRETIPSSGKGSDIKGANPSDWVSGFFPGTLWYIYEYTGDEYWKSMAERYTARLGGQRYNTGTHDLGFMMYCSYGNGYRLTGNPDYREILLTSARSLSARYNPDVGCIRSWDFPGWWEQYPVIIDNMMNLELLMWASKASGIEAYEKIALNHSMKTLRDQYRSDFSCYHMVDYNSSTGQPMKKGTYQGAFDESSWARGQAWGFYGFIMMFRESGNRLFLDHASRIADYLLSELEEDPIPTWDFSLMDEPGEEKDASSAAIISSALIELYTHTGDERYLTTARRILIELSTPHYSGGEGEVGGFLLKHSVGNKPANSGVDIQLNYTDYYYIEAILRLSHIGFQTKQTSK